jgi:hypothetical protein
LIPPDVVAESNGVPFFFATRAMRSTNFSSAACWATARFFVVHEGTSECGFSSCFAGVGIVLLRRLPIQLLSTINGCCYNV